MTFDIAANKQYLCGLNYALTFEYFKLADTIFEKMDRPPLNLVILCCWNDRKKFSIWKPIVAQLDWIIEHGYDITESFEIYYALFDNIKFRDIFILQNLDTMEITLAEILLPRLTRDEHFKERMQKLFDAGYDIRTWVSSMGMDIQRYFSHYHSAFTMPSDMKFLCENGMQITTDLLSLVVSFYSIEIDWYLQYTTPSSRQTFIELNEHRFQTTKPGVIQKIKNYNPGQWTKAAKS